VPAALGKTYAGCFQKGESRGSGVFQRGYDSFFYIIPYDHNTNDKINMAGCKQKSSLGAFLLLGVCIVSRRTLFKGTFSSSIYI
jgi:hypothetical protein